ncbi:MAG: glycosyltransferase family 2 protein [Acidobacteriota bacterium]
MSTLHALICAFNEAKTVGEVVTRTRPHVARVTVVDDGSADGTSALAEAAGAAVLRHETNRGKGAAVRTGLDAILATDATHVLFIDADRQHDPAEIPRLAAAAAGGAGVVIGSRFAEKEAIPRHRYLANAIGGRVLSLFAGVRLEDTQSGYRLIDADLLRRITIEREDFAIETEILLKAVGLGARVAYVPIRAIYFADRRSRFRPIRDTVRISMAALRFRFFGTKRAR